jgi:transcriptional regulator with XRE-family HTH domain
MPRRPGTATLARRLGARIRTLRQEAGITQEKLAWACNFSKPYLSQIEAGKRLPSLAAVVVLAKKLGVEPADMLVLDDKNTRLRLMDAVRREDAEAVEATLRELGYSKA